MEPGQNKCVTSPKILEIERMGPEILQTETMVGDLRMKGKILYVVGYYSFQAENWEEATSWEIVLR